MSLSSRLALLGSSTTDADREPTEPLAGDRFVHHAYSWRIHPGIARRSILGGALDDLELPTRSAAREALAMLADGSAKIDAGDPAVFLDLETTSLLTGPGAMPFLVGLVWYEREDHLRVEQWTLTTLSGESAMLEEVAATLARILKPGTAIVTFNGSSFDLPLLRIRFSRARIDATVLAGPHVDLLHPSRRLWRGRFDDCRLQTLERERLGVARLGDLEGPEIPGVFWRCIEEPQSLDAQRELGRTRVHNEADLLTLSALAVEVADGLQNPSDLAAAVGAARHHVLGDDRERALEVLEPHLREHWRAPVRARLPPLAREASLLAADLHRRQKRHDHAARIWRWVCTCFAGDARAHEALAIHLEHRLRRPAEALAVAEAGRAPCPRRLIRLQRKLARQGLSAAVSGV